VRISTEKAFESLAKLMAVQKRSENVEIPFVRKKTKLMAVQKR
jgi:hypothetical protein